MHQARNKSIVEYFGPGPGHSCGYCKSEDTNFSYGMWGHKMNVQDYQDLVNRGWRRSGCYLYRPQLDIQCCPMYPIKCNVLNFKLSNSHKKVIKNFNRYINYDIQPKPSEENMASVDGQQPEADDTGKTKPPGEDSPHKIKRVPRPGVGADVNKPKCVKAKVMKAERLKEKTMMRIEVGDSMSEGVQKKPSTAAKSLEEYLNEIVENPKHRLRIELVESERENEERIVSTSHAVYSRYQTTVHLDEPSSVLPKQFKRFLIQSPLIREKNPPNHPGYGSFHQQYWIDDDLVAVGVIDVLPGCVSSVYLFYDPKFNFLSLGTYTALREIAFVRKLQLVDEKLSHYYMGFYIHSCPKMRYKGQYKPSFLLCPETFTWHPIERCLPRLDSHKYSRFAESDVDDEEGKRAEAKDALVLNHGQIFKFSDLRRMGRGSGRRSDLEEMRHYVKLVGKKCCEGMLLVRQ